MNIMTDLGNGLENQKWARTNPDPGQRAQVLPWSLWNVQKQIAIWCTCSKSDPSGFHLEVKWECTAKLPSKITALKNKLYWNKICWLRLDFDSQHIQQSLPAQYWSCGLFLTLLEQDWELSTQTVNSMDKKNILFFLTTASLQKMWIFSVTWIIICC